MFRNSTKTCLFRWVIVSWIVLSASAVSWADIDPVEGLEAALERGNLDEIDAQIDKLETIPDLLRASYLSKFLAATDLTPFDQKLLQRLEKKIHEPLLQKIQAVVTDGSPLEKRAVAMNVAETKVEKASELLKAPAARRYRTFLRSLSTQMDQLVTSDKSPPVVRQSAARALARILVEPKQSVEAIESLFHRKTLAEKRTAMQVLGGMVEQHGTLWKKFNLQELLNLEDAARVAGYVVPVARLGLGHSDLVVRRNALAALGEVGEFAEGVLSVPEAAVLAPIAGQMKAESDLLEKYIFKKLGALPNDETFLRLLNDPDAAVRMLSRRVLEHLANIRLRTQLRRKYTNLGVADMPDPFATGWRRAVETLAADINDPKLEVRLAAVHFLERLGTPAKIAVGALAGRLQDPSPFVRWAAARALGRIGYLELKPFTTMPQPTDPLDERVLVQVIDGLGVGVKDRDVDARKAATDIVGGLGFTLESIKSEETKRQATSIVRRAVPHLLVAVQMGDPETRIAALKAIQYTGIDKNTATNAAEVLARVLEHPNATVRKAAAEALGRLDVFVPAAKSALEQALQDDEAEVREAASAALLNILSKKEQ